MLVAGLFLGALGDLWLLRDGDRAFLIGLVSFALRHLAYIGLLWQFGAVAQMSVWAIAIGLLACGMALILWPRAGTLSGPVLGYVGIIAVMGVLVVGLPAHCGLARLRRSALWSRTRFWPANYSC